VISAVSDYYVYVYIDPRNYEEFYYGKGRGSRKIAHLHEKSNTAKTRRIAAIRKEGLEPIVRVIASGLVEAEALLIEKTLLWKLGKLTTNVATGHFARKFRPPNTLHRELAGFDYQCGIYYYNVGDGHARKWEDYVKHGFIAAGHGLRWRDAMLGFKTGDVFAAYLKGRGFVGVGRIKSEARMARDVNINGKSLLSLQLEARGMSENLDNPTLSEYVCLVDWIKQVPRTEAKFRKSPKLYTTTHVRASLEGQPTTISFIEEAFGLTIPTLIR
jgi:uncharacterized protein